MGLFLTQMMKKINNKKNIVFYTRILIILLILLFFGGFTLLFLKPVSSHLQFSLICVVTFIIVFYIFLKLRLFEYENSLQFISIKQPYFWKINPSVKPIEFPIDMLVGFSIREGLFTTSLKLIIRPQEQKTKILYCKIAGLSKGQVVELKQSLQNAKEYTEK